MRKVLLFLPPYPGQPLGPPTGLLCLAAVLLQSGYQVEVVDGAIVPNYLEVIENKANDALCFGVSVLTGPMIAGAVEASRLVKRLRPNLPVIFGGWHPTLLAEQTLRECFIDLVVRNQGELTLLEIVQRIEAGRGFDDVAGCSFKSGGLIRHNPDRVIVSLNELPVPAYDLVDFDRYELACGQRKLPYATSVGCPYACNYCTDSVFYRRIFNSQSAQRVIDDVTKLVAKHRIREVALLDSNFLVDHRRAIQIAKGFEDSGSGFSWTFQTSTDLMRRFSDDDVLLLGKSGVTHIGFGVESASEHVLSIMNKGHQKIEDVFESARKCRKAGIRATFNLIFGFPGETESDRHWTFKAMGDLASRYDNVTFSANLFTPYPGIPIWPELRALGLREPSSLNDWASLGLGMYALPWLNSAIHRKIAKGISIFTVCNKITKAFWNSSVSPFRRCMLRGIQKLSFARMRHHFFEWPLEQWLLRTGIASGRGV